MAGTQQAMESSSCEPAAQQSLQEPLRILGMVETLLSPPPWRKKGALCDFGVSKLPLGSAPSLPWAKEQRGSVARTAL